ncbi:MAG: (2Fe-2S)-binding protein [Chloroflexi bacterium]|nr:(2Fe-2S)-binding protein [Chloroflexota bacterium]
MKTVTLSIDGKKVFAHTGEKVLWAALDNGIYIPNLCAMRENSEEPMTACRLCFVEIEGYAQPVTACTEPVREGLEVSTRGERALRLARSGLELLLASHPIECARCPVNRACELQRMAAHLGIKLKTRRLRKFVHEFPIDSSSPLFVYDPNKCVLCGRCVFICQKLPGTPAIGFAHRGFDRRVTTCGDEPIGNRCGDCTECVSACPSGALVFKSRSPAADGS